MSTLTPAVDVMESSAITGVTDRPVGRDTASRTIGRPERKLRTFTGSPLEGLYMIPSEMSLCDDLDIYYSDSLFRLVESNFDAFIGSYHLRVMRDVETSMLIMS